jgi:hypothetical protein
MMALPVQNGKPSCGSGDSDKKSYQVVGELVFEIHAIVFERFS